MYGVVLGALNYTKNGTIVPCWQRCSRLPKIIQNVHETCYPVLTVELCLHPKDTKQLNVAHFFIIKSSSVIVKNSQHSGIAENHGFKFFFFFISRNWGLPSLA